MIGISVIARLESTRLSQKHLIEVNEKPFIEWLILRLKNEFQDEIRDREVEICITTSDTIINRTFLQLEAIEGVTVFFGNSFNIPLRLKQCASARRWNGVISVDGDDILCSPLACRKVFETLKLGEKYVKTEGLPLGMNVSGFSTNYLKGAVKDTNETMETGWGRLFRAEPTVIRFNELTDRLLRFTLDYQADADFFSAIMAHLGQEKSIEVDDKEIVETVIANDLDTINSDLNGIYWENFNQQIEKEDE